MEESQDKTAEVLAVTLSLILDSCPMEEEKYTYILNALAIAAYPRAPSVEKTVSALKLVYSDLLQIQDGIILGLKPEYMEMH